MIRKFAVTCYWKDTGRMRKEYIYAKDEKDLSVKIEEKGGYRIRSINERWDHLPNRHQLMKCRKYGIDVKNKTRKELRALIKQYENGLN